MFKHNCLIIITYNEFWPPRENHLQGHPSVLETQKRIVLNCQKVNDFIIIILINGKYLIDVIKTQYILKAS